MSESNPTTKDLAVKIDHLTDLVDGLAISTAHGFEELRHEIRKVDHKVDLRVGEVQRELGQVKHIVEGQTGRFDNHDKRVIRVEKHLDLKPIS